ncbi:MAG: hypothetical protein K9I94_14670 [Bacteroidales bacterium]|nr:hypothetical protein [Bacteroidales bacterium]
MTYKTKSILLWSFAVVFTIATAAYQRMTGPTYPVSDSKTVNNYELEYELPRSHGGAGDAKVEIPVPNDDFKGYYEYRRYKSHDKWQRKPMINDNDTLVAHIPHQPPAGKVMYKIIIENNGKEKKITEEPVIIRFKGAVPATVLIPHIVLMFLAMLFSTRTGLEAIINGKRTYLYTGLTLLFIIPGGLILGPVVQKYAFDAYWTGWPFGSDLTDNKTLAAFIFWIIAFFRLRKNRNARWWALAAAIVTLAVYLIPHSVMGSEIDYTQQAGNMQ